MLSCALLFQELSSLLLPKLQGCPDGNAALIHPGGYCFRHHGAGGAEVDAAQRLSRLQEALTLLESGRNRQAERICRQLLDRDGSDIEALLLLGLAAGARGKTDVAAPILNRVARARGSNAHPCGDLARILIAQGKTPLVEPQYRACLALTPDDARLRYGLAEFLRDRGDGEASVAVLEPLLSVQPDSAEA
jgi:Flp pilus assembly protein TadD